MFNKQEKEKLAQQLASVIQEAIIEKQGIDIVQLDFTEMSNSVASYFVICHADSGTQMQAIASHVEREVRKKMNARVWSKEGESNLEWILLDFVDVVVHIFNSETRSFFQLEKLWADAKVSKF